jgi:DNA polymerase-3 subunit gamma/tau
MLGTVDRTQVGALLDALADGDGARLMATIATLAEFSPDWGGVLEAFAEALHRIQVRQLVPGVAIEAEGVDAEGFAQRLRPEVVQLWYQMALNGRRDLYLAPSPRAGFEMSLLRMLAFRPAGEGDVAPASAAPAKPAAGTGDEANSGRAAAAPLMPEMATAPHAPAEPVSAPVPKPPAAPEPEAAPFASVPPAQAASTPAPAPAPAMDDVPPWEVPAQKVRVAEPGQAAPNASAAPATPARAPSAPPPPPSAPPPSGDGIVDADHWLALVASAKLSGPSRQLAANVAFASYGDAVLRLSLAPGLDYLRTDRSVGDLADALSASLGRVPKIVFDTGAVAGEGAETLAMRDARQQDARRASAEEQFMNHPDVQRLIQQHGARVVPDSIRPFDE